MSQPTEKPAEPADDFGYSKDTQEPDKVTHLTKRAVRKIVETDPAELKQHYFYLQAIHVKTFDGQQQKGKDERKQVKMRFTFSDGESTVLAMMNKQVFDRMETQHIQMNSVIQVFTFIKQTLKEKTILVLSRPPKVIYDGMESLRIGDPRDYETNLKEGFKDHE